METRPRRRELDQDRDGSVRLRRRNGEEAVCDLALHHHAPHARCREGRRGSRRRSGWRRCTGGSRRASSARGRGLRDRAAGRRPSGASRSGRRRRRGDAVRAVGRARRRGRARTARPACGSAHRGPGRSRARRRRVELGQPGDDAEDVVIDEEVLPEGLLGLGPLTSGGARRLRWRCGRSPARAARCRLRAPGPGRRACAARWPARSLAAQRLRGEVRAVGLGENPVAGDRRGGSRSSSAFG